jgi:hypothetical protein
LNASALLGHRRAAPETLAKASVLVLALIVGASGTPIQTQAQAQNQNWRQRHEQRRTPETAAVPVDKRDSVVSAVGPYSGRPYWLALAQCGGIYFKLNVLYTDIAVRARVVKPDARTNAEYSKKLTEAIKTATTFFDGAEHFLMTDRGIERSDAVLTYDGESRAAADKLKTVEAALAAAQSCPALYQACRQAYSKQCNETLAPAG